MLAAGADLFWFVSGPGRACCQILSGTVSCVSHILALSEADLVLTVLALVDIALVGSLIIMVMLSGYENFVSKINVEGANEKPG